MLDAFERIARRPDAELARLGEHRLHQPQTSKVIGWDATQLLELEAVQCASASDHAVKFIRNPTRLQPAT